MPRTMFVMLFCVVISLTPYAVYAQDTATTSASESTPACEVCKAPEDPTSSEAYKALEKENLENLSGRMGLSRQLAIEHARPSRGDVVGWTMIGVCTLFAGYGVWRQDWVLTGGAGACMAGGTAMVLVW